MQVSYRLEEEDYRALARFLLRQTPRGRHIMRRGIAWAILLSVAAALLIHTLRADAILSALFGAFCFVFMYILRQRAATAYEIKIYLSIRPDDNRRMRDPGTLALTPEHLEAHYREGAGKMPWRGVTQVGRDNSHIFIILGRANAFAIPKREFETPEAFEAFYQAALQYHLQAKT